MSIHTFRKRLSFIWGCFFPVSILKTNVFPFTAKWANKVVLWRRMEPIQPFNNIWFNIYIRYSTLFFVFLWLPSNITSFLNFQNNNMTRIIMSLSPDRDQMIKLWFAFSIACNTAFVSASSWEDIIKDVKVKLECSIFDNSSSEDRMTVSAFIFAKQ